MIETARYQELREEAEFLAVYRAEYEALAVLFSASPNRDPLRERLDQLVQIVSRGEWPGYDEAGPGGGQRADEPREPLTPGAVFLVTSICRLAADYPPEGLPSAERWRRASIRYEWAKSAVGDLPAGDHRLVELEAKELQARARIPGRLDESITGLTAIVDRLHAASVKLNFVRSVQEVNLANLLSRRGSTADIARTSRLLDVNYRWRSNTYGEKHPLTMVARGNQISALLRKSEGPLPFAAARHQAELDEVLPQAESLYADRRAIFGDRASTVAIALVYLARISLALVRVDEAINYAERAIAAIPDSGAGEDNLTLPIAQVVLAQSYVLEHGHGAKLRPDIVFVAEELAARAAPALARSSISENWLARAQSLHALGGPRASLTNP